MADRQPRRLWRIVLVASLAVNLAVAGVVGGLALRSSGPQGAPRGFDVGLGTIGSALEREDRRAISQALRNAPGLRPGSRKEQGALVLDVVAALRADPLSEADLVAALTAPGVQAAVVRQAAMDALKERIVGMTVAQRDALADRLDALHRERRGR